MYCFAKICCLCLQHSPQLNKLDETDQHGLTFFEKLLVLIPGFGKLVKKTIPNYLCKKCKRYVNKFYKFQQNCLKSYKLLESYVCQLDETNEESSENNVIEEDLILIKEDMEECLKNIDLYIEIEDSDNETMTSTSTTNPVNVASSPLVNGSPVEPSNYRKRTRAPSKKISYNEDYDSDTMFSDSEVYLTKCAKRKRTKTRKEMDNAPKQDKTVVIPQNDIFAKDLTHTINGIITRLSAAGNVGTKPEEVKVKFKNSSGNTEQLSIYQDEDSVEIRFTKEEKMGYLRVSRQGDNIILTHNMSDSIGLDLLNLQKIGTSETWTCNICHKVFQDSDSLARHVDEYANLSEISCKICDKVFEDLENLRRHIQDHGSSSTLSTSPFTNSPIPSAASTGTVDTIDEASLTNGENVKTEVATSQYCEMKVVLSEIQENASKSERSSSPEYPFHLSDDELDEFDNNSPAQSPVQLGTHVLEFLEETDTPNSSVRVPEEPCVNGQETEALPETVALPEKVNVSQMKEPETPTIVPEIVEPKIQNPNIIEKTTSTTPEKNLTENVNGNLSESFEEKLLKIVVNKMEVEEFIKRQKQKELEMSRKRSSPRRQIIDCKITVDKIKVCTQCKVTFNTQRKLEGHLEAVHSIITHNLDLES